MLSIEIIRFLLGVTVRIADDGRRSVATVPASRPIAVYGTGDGNGTDVPLKPIQSPG
jgi:hypothetical protein